MVHFAKSIKQPGVLENPIRLKGSRCYQTIVLSTVNGSDGSKGYARFEIKDGSLQCSNNYRETHKKELGNRCDIGSEERARRQNCHCVYNLCGDP